MLLIILLLLIFQPFRVNSKEKYIYEYNPEGFKQQVEEMEGNFIMFYAPWCQHCTDFEPIWSELAEILNTKESKFAIGQIDCTKYPKLCNDNGITGYPTLLYFHKKSFTPVEYKGTRDLPSLTLYLSDTFLFLLNQQSTVEAREKNIDEVKIYSGMAYLKDNNIEKFVSQGQHFIMFYAPWCRASQRLTKVWAELAIHYSSNEDIHIGKVNCVENDITCKNFDVKQYPYLMWITNGRITGIANYETLEELKTYVEKMILSEDHDPGKFMKKKKALPVARISEEIFETSLENDLVFINFFAPWCAHCMQLSPLWIKLGEKFQNDTRVLIGDVDCVRSIHVCEMQKIISLPTLILYKKSKIVEMENGGRPFDSLVTLVNEHLNQLETDASKEETKDKTSEKMEPEEINPNPKTNEVTQAAQTEYTKEEL